MGDHFHLDVDGGAVAAAARRLGELGEHLGTRGRRTLTAPDRWAHGWRSRTAGTVGRETTVLGNHLVGFAEHFSHAGAALLELSRDLDQAEQVDVPDLNRRWAAAETAYDQALAQADDRYRRGTDGLGRDVPPQVEKMARLELADARSAATSDASAARTATQTKLELEFEDLCDRLRRHARRVSGVLARSVAVPVPDTVVAAYQASQGNLLGRVMWDLGGDLLGSLTGAARQQLAGPMERLADELVDPPQDYARIKELLARARELGLPPAQYAETLKWYWRHRAAEVAGIDLADWDPAKGADHNRATIEAVYRYYGDLYLANPGLQWAGMANMIGPSFAAGFFDLAQFRRLADAVTDIPEPLRGAVPDGVEDLADIPEEELRFYETQFLDMQQQIFFDQGSMHQAYVDGGLDAVRELQQAGLINEDLLDGWRDIDSGVPERVREGNELFLLREQRDIIDDDYRTMYDHDPTGPAMTWVMTQIGEPSIPGARGYADVFPLHVRFETPGPEDIGTPDRVFGVDVPSVSFDNPTQVHVDVETPFADGNIADFDDRWRLIEDDTLPRFQELLAADPGRARDIIASDVHDRIGDYRLSERVDDILLRLLDWEIDVDQ